MLKSTRWAFAAALLGLAYVVLRSASAHQSVDHPPYYAPPPPTNHAAADALHPSTTDVHTTLIHAGAVHADDTHDDIEAMLQRLARKPNGNRRARKIRRALRHALRDALDSAEPDSDPLELLAYHIHALGGKHLRASPAAASSSPPPPPSSVALPLLAASPPPPPPPPPLSASAPPPTLSSPAAGSSTYPPRSTGGLGAPSEISLPTKVPTARMWPPLPAADAAGAAYSSLGQLEPYRGGDLEQPGELARAVNARSYNGELILTYGNEMGTAWIANLVFSLRAAGIEHFLVIVMSDEHCAALSRPPWRISCAWSSWDFGACKRKMEMRRLWYSRHHYMSRVIAEHEVNVAVIDGDIAVRDSFYPHLKAEPLARHNLIYTLDHGPTCGDLNVGFEYCQGCAKHGRAQWVIDEGLKREGYFCGGDEREFGDGGNFWGPSDAARATTGPHRWIEWASARDQKLYSDVAGGACCGKPQHRLLFPSSYKVVDQYTFMRQFGQHSSCMTMTPQKSNGLQTWWHELLSNGTSSGGGPRETIAIATGRLASGWHGTGFGEIAGWSGHWIRTPPAIAHFVGGGPAGGKVEIMQGLGWWYHEADAVAHTVANLTNKSAGYALPTSYFEPATRRGVLALAGPAATVRAATSAEFLRKFGERRAWLLKVATLLGRTAVDPLAECDAAWVVSDRTTGHSGEGYRSRWYTPSWPWPFFGGVGVVPANCTHAAGAARAPAECCAPIFGKVDGEGGVGCMETAHHALLETLLEHVPGDADMSRELDLDSLMAGKAIDARRLKVAAAQYSGLVLWVRPPTELPPVRGLDEADAAAISKLVKGKCRALVGLPS